MNARTHQILIAPLASFSGPGSLQLGRNVSIDHIRPKVYDFLTKPFESGWIKHPLNYSHCLVLRETEATDDHLEYPVEEVILRLRLFKPGNVAFGIVISDARGWYDDLTTAIAEPDGVRAIFFYSAWLRPGLQHTYELSEAELPKLIRLLESTSSRTLMDAAPYRAFFRAYHEPYATDRFLSTAIAMEHLLVNDTEDTSSISYKFVDRGCYLLNRARPHPDGAEAYVAPLRTIYRWRSSLVHASPRLGERDWTEERHIDILRQADEYARAMLLYTLDHPDLAKAEKLDEQKRKGYGSSDVR